MAKYFAVAHLLDEMSVDYCVYADGDLLVLGDLTESFDELSNKIILLTPHVLGPVGDAREQGFLVHGWANAGFFCVRREAGQTRLVLDWLVQRVSERGFLAPHLGLSCDQTWLSSLPYLFHDQTVVSQNPALNVAYWNLEERQLSSRDGRILVSGRPLLFFHFSGFDSADSRLLSKHADVRVSEGTTLSLLWHLYASELASVVPLTTALNELDVLSFSTSPLSERLLAGSVENGINIDGPFVRPGLFSRIGHRFDLLLARKGWKNGTA